MDGQELGYEAVDDEGTAGFAGMDAGGNEEELFVVVWLAGFCIFGDGENGNGKARDAVGQDLHFDMRRLIIEIDFL